MIFNLMRKNLFSSYKRYKLFSNWQLLCTFVVYFAARVVKLVDTHVSGACGFGRAGSTPAPGTNPFQNSKKQVTGWCRTIFNSLFFSMLELRGEKQRVHKKKKEKKAQKPHDYYNIKKKSADFAKKRKVHKNNF